MHLFVYSDRCLMILQVAKSAEEALKTCKDDETSAPCAAAWDEYEELSAEQAHSRDRKKLSADPLEVYCAENPETDECRVYEDWALCIVWLGSLLRVYSASISQNWTHMQVWGNKPDEEEDKGVLVLCK